MQGLLPEAAGQNWRHLIEAPMLGIQAAMAAGQGKMKEARELNERAVEMAKRLNFTQVAASFILGEASAEAFYGNIRRARVRTVIAWPNCLRYTSAVPSARGV